MLVLNLHIPIMNYSIYPFKSVSSQISALILWLALTFSASITAIFVSATGWYATLQKPAWTPAPWVFAPVWTLLYFLMALAAWLVWREGGWEKQKGPLGLFLIQLGLNALWTPLFFHWHLPEIAFCEIILLWFAVVATLISFWRVKKSASLLLIPYIIWVSIAALLNYKICSLN
jgi:translocator protein